MKKNIILTLLALGFSATPRATIQDLLKNLSLENLSLDKSRALINRALALSPEELSDMKNDTAKEYWLNVHYMSEHLSEDDKRNMESLRQKKSSYEQKVRAQKEKEDREDLQLVENFKRAEQRGGQHGHTEAEIKNTMAVLKSMGLVCTKEDAIEALTAEKNFNQTKTDEEYARQVQQKQQDKAGSQLKKDEEYARQVEQEEREQQNKAGSQLKTDKKLAMKLQRKEVEQSKNAMDKGTSDEQAARQLQIEEWGLVGKKFAKSKSKNSTEDLARVPGKMKVRNQYIDEDGFDEDTKNAKIESVLDSDLSDAEKNEEINRILEEDTDAQRRAGPSKRKKIGQNVGNDGGQHLVATHNRALQGATVKNVEQRMKPRVAISREVWEEGDKIDRWNEVSKAVKSIAALTGEETFNDVLAALEGNGAELANLEADGGRFAKLDNYGRALLNEDQKTEAMRKAQVMREEIRDDIVSFKNFIIPKEFSAFEDDANPNTDYSNTDYSKKNLMENLEKTARIFRMIGNREINNRFNKLINMVESNKKTAVLPRESKTRESQMVKSTMDFYHKKLGFSSAEALKKSLKFFPSTDVKSILSIMPEYVSNWIPKQDVHLLKTLTLADLRQKEGMLKRESQIKNLFFKWISLEEPVLSSIMGAQQKKELVDILGDKIKSYKNQITALIGTRKHGMSQKSEQDAKAVIQDDKDARRSALAEKKNPIAKESKQAVEDKKAEQDVAKKARVVRFSLEEKK